MLPNYNFLTRLSFNLYDSDQLLWFNFVHSLSFSFSGIWTRLTFRKDSYLVFQLSDLVLSQRLKNLDVAKSHCNAICLWIKARIACRVTVSSLQPDFWANELPLRAFEVDPLPFYNVCSWRCCSTNLIVDVSSNSVSIVLNKRIVRQNSHELNQGLSIFKISLPDMRESGFIWSSNIRAPIRLSPMPLRRFRFIRVNKNSSISRALVGYTVTNRTFIVALSIYQINLYQLVRGYSVLNLNVVRKSRTYQERYGEYYF